VPGRQLHVEPATVIALDYGGSISLDHIDHLIGQKPVDPAAATALRALHHDLGLRLILAAATHCRARPGGPRFRRPGSTTCSTSPSSLTRRRRVAAADKSW
jgi:hypothetical protein